MKQIAKRFSAAGLAALLLLCAACGSQDPAPPPEDPGQADSAGFSYTQVTNREFYFSSGAGGWCTILYVEADGSFHGNYHDSDMGDAGDDYPNGTLYYCDFSGQFGAPEQVNDYTWLLPVTSLEYANEAGSELIDGILYCYTDAYGLSGASELLLYLPGAPVTELPEAYRGWVGYYNLDSLEEPGLPYYGLYNSVEQLGFSSYEATNLAKQTTEKLESAEQESADLDQLLEAGFLDQLGINETAGAIYTVWDDLLNELWGILKDTLDADRMKQLTAEQLTWIENKEGAAEAAAAEFGEGSMAPAEYYLVAGDMTRERVYDLADILKGL